jgi:hypothetical protein
MCGECLARNVLLRQSVVELDTILFTHRHDARRKFMDSKILPEPVLLPK